MAKADAALNILRTKVHNYENYGAKDEKEIQDRMKVIQDAKYEKVDGLMIGSSDGYGGKSKFFCVKIKSKVGPFVAKFSNYKTSKTAEEERLDRKLKDLTSKRKEIGGRLRKKLDDITLKVNIAGLDGETTELLKGFVKELEALGV